MAYKTSHKKPFDQLQNVKNTNQPTDYEVMACLMPRWTI